MRVFSSREFSGIKAMVFFDDDIPEHVKEDASKRVHDWLSVEGHSETDDYIKNQYQYLVRGKESIK